MAWTHIPLAATARSYMVLHSSPFSSHNLLCCCIRSPNQATGHIMPIVCQRRQNYHHNPGHRALNELENAIVLQNTVNSHNNEWLTALQSLEPLIPIELPQKRLLETVLSSRPRAYPHHPAASRVTSVLSCLCDHHSEPMLLAQIWVRFDPFVDEHALHGWQAW